MKNKFLLSTLFLILIVGIYIPVSYSQVPTYTCTLANDTVYAPGNVYEFDVYILRTGTVAFELAGFQIGLTYDTLALNGGTITATWVAGKTDAIFHSNEQLHIPAQYSAGIIRVASFLPPGHGTGTIIPNTAPGGRIGRLRLTNSVSFTSHPLSVNWTFSTYPSKISAYVTAKDTDITKQSTFLNTLANLGYSARVLTLTAFLEGPFNGTVMDNTGGPLTVTVELRKISDNSFVESQTGNLNTNGVGTFSFTTAVNGTPYYIILKSKNTIETQSASGQSFVSGVLSYDFTTGIGQAYTDGGSVPQMIQKGTKWCVFSGDLNQDGGIDAFDLSPTNNDNTSGGTPGVPSGLPTDVTNDGGTDVFDLSIIDNNNSRGVYAQLTFTPPAAKGIKHSVKSQVKNKK
jgi:hypothetical protein